MRPETPSERSVSILAVGFGTTISMWALGYLAHLPGSAVSGAVLGPLLIACLGLGGFVIARHTDRGLLGGFLVGLVAGVLNLLVVGSVTGDAAPTASVPTILIWAPGSVLASAVLATIGAAVGRLVPGPRFPGDLWRSAFILIAAVATLLVLIAGGLVTSLEAGLAVPDWPNTFESNMFLYPLSRMTGGIYYEHAHRLYGSLVGLTTIVLAVTLLVTDRRRWLRGLAVLAVAMVIAQGLLGGLRVTGRFTLEANPEAITPNDMLAIVHGIFGQLFFSFVLLLWAFTTRTWRSDESGHATEAAVTDRFLTAGLVLLTITQLTLGAFYRHLATPEVPLPWPAAAHLTLAFVVALVACLVGLRAWAIHAGEPMLSRLGRALVVAVALQLLLGLSALVPLLAARPEWKTAEVILATAHQANGAIVLALAIQMMVWSRRLLRAP